MSGSDIAVEALRLLFVPALTALVVHKLGRWRTRRDAICRCCDETLQLLRTVDDAARVYWMASFPQPTAGMRHPEAGAPVCQDAGVPMVRLGPARCNRGLQ